MNRTARLAAALPLAASLLWAGAALAADNGVVVDNGGARALSAAAMANAKPLKNILPAPDTSGMRLSVTNDNLTTGVVAGSTGTIGGNSTRAFGSFGIPYTSTRVVAGGSSYTSASVGLAYLSTTSPYRAVGKLFIGNPPFGYCSASLIRRSIIVTAAHCIQNFGGGANIFGGWTFMPGRYSPAGATATQMAPYGSFFWRAIIRPPTWSTGTDIGSGAARDNDLALIALRKNASSQFVGQLTGYLGYSWNNYSSTSSAKTGNLQVLATSTLGYPGLMDSGQIMQRADGPSYTTTIAGAHQIWQGSNYTEGSSGGPWVVNFGAANPVLSGGAVLGAQPVMAVIGVTSWGSADPNSIKDNYSSQFRQNTAYPGANYGGYGAGNIGSLMNTLCNYVLDGSTLASQGYCS